MAGKGGGAWKVAYADFVTAMMAFFLVMWLVGQDQKIKQAVAFYFMDPLGAGKKPSKTGTLDDHPVTGVVPETDKVEGSTGVGTFSQLPDPSPPTKRVNDWLQKDPKAFAKWRDEAARHLAAAAAAPEVRKNHVTAHQYAAHMLAKQMRADATKTMPGQVTGLHQELMLAGLGEVNWKEIAEIFLDH